MSIPSISESNQSMINLIDKKEPFLISRMGYAIGMLAWNYKANIEIPRQIKIQVQTHDGIYCNNMGDLIKYAEMYADSIETSTYLACFPKIYNQWQDFFLEKYSLKALHNRVLEPFYILLENETPWTHKLKGKKILVINPFVDSMKKQLANNFQIFKDKQIFLDDQEFIFYKSFNSLANNRPHNDWNETYQIMCNDIKDLDFDLALLGCGGYGLPLCKFINKKMKKSAIYIGGALQLLFGVMGKRWENNPMWKKIISENNTKFIRPSGDEIIKNTHRIENSCYW